MSRRMEGKRAYITGAGGTMGQAIAIRMASEGAAALALIDRVPERLAQLERALSQYGTRCSSYVIDLSDMDAAAVSVDAAAADMGGLDVVVANAGVLTLKSFFDAPFSEIANLTAVNYLAPYAIAQAAAKIMMKTRGGSILFTAALSEKLGLPDYPAYSASKSALINLVFCLGPLLGPHNIRVNSVSPGYMPQTNMGPDALGLTDRAAIDAAIADMTASMSKHVPLGRIAQPEDIAAAFVFLASDEASYISGINLTVDGAATLIGPLRGGK